MPRSPLKPCPRTLPNGRRCAALIPPKQTLCLPHAQESMREWDAARGTAASRGYDSRHRRWRATIIARDPYCRIAVKCAGNAASTVADHVKPLQQGGDFNLDNGQGCCAPCHDWKRAALDKRGITIEQWRAEQSEYR